MLYALQMAPVLRHWLLVDLPQSCLLACPTHSTQANQVHARDCPLCRKVEARGSCTGKGRPLYFLTATSLCPLIWAYIIAMLAVFVRKVRHL